MRIIPKAFAMVGTISGSQVPYHPKKTIILKKGIILRKGGIAMVLNIRTKIGFLNLKSYFARANPPMVQKKITVTVERSAIPRLLRKFTPKGISWKSAPIL